MEKLYAIDNTREATGTIDVYMNDQAAVVALFNLSS